MPLDEANELFSHDEAEEAIARRDVSKLLAKLPPAKRQLVADIKLDGLSVAEAAQRSGLSESAVKVTVHRAIKSLGEDVNRESQKRQGGDADR